MSIFKKQSKSEITRKARLILRGYRVDLLLVRIISTPKTISLFGLLIKQDGTEFTLETIVSLKNELSALARVQTDLVNWNLNSDIHKIDYERKS